MRANFVEVSAPGFDDDLCPLAYAARNASVPQQPGALRLTTGFAPQAVATQDLTGPNDERILPATG